MRPLVKTADYDKPLHYNSSSADKTCTNHKEKNYIDSSADPIIVDHIDSLKVSPACPIEISKAYLEKIDKFIHFASAMAPKTRPQPSDLHPSPEDANRQRVNYLEQTVGTEARVTCQALGHCGAEVASTSASCSRAYHNTQCRTASPSCPKSSSTTASQRGLLCEGFCSDAPTLVTSLC